MRLRNESIIIILIIILLFIDHPLPDLHRWSPFLLLAIEVDLLV
jgi:hypothetical protein